MTTPEHDPAYDSVLIEMMAERQSIWKLYEATPKCDEAECFCALRAQYHMTCIALDKRIAARIRQ